MIAVAPAIGDEDGSGLPVDPWFMFRQEARIRHRRMARKGSFLLFIVKAIQSE